MRFRRLGIRLKVGMGLAFALLTAAAAFAQEYDQKFFSEMHWRGIGPFRGGRTKALQVFPASRTCFTSACATEACGSRTTTAADGRPSSISNPRARSGRWLWRLPIRTLFMWGA